jgi:CheY-like chemotaxis protein
MARILAVDDDPDMLELLGDVLRAGGHQVTTADSGPAATAALASDGPVDLIVSDVSMPAMSGLELLVMLRRRPGLERLPAIFVTALPLPGVLKVDLQLGVLYLNKPFDVSALLDAVDKSLEIGHIW